jgi:hypothetical protein
MMIMTMTTMTTNDSYQSITKYGSISVLDTHKTDVINTLNSDSI